MITILGAGGVIANEVVRLISARKQPFRLVARNARPVPAATEMIFADLSDKSLKRHLSSRYDAGLFASQQAYAEAKGSFIAAVTEQAVAQGYPRTATTP